MRMYPYQIKDEQGVILFWVLFLLFFISVSSLFVVRTGLAQQVLVSFYDQQYQQARKLRALERDILNELTERIETNNIPVCLVADTKYTACSFIDHLLMNRDTLDGIKLWGRSLNALEKAQLGALGTVDDPSVGKHQWVALELQYHSSFSSNQNEQVIWLYRMSRWEYLTIEMNDQELNTQDVTSQVLSNSNLDRQNGLESNQVQLIVEVDVKRILAWTI